MSIADRLNALGRGAAQGATGMFGDEGFAKIMDYLPRPDDDTGIPREYAGGAQDQYLRSARADDANAARKYPANFGIGALLGAAPAAIAAAPLGVPGAIGLGAVQAAGGSENKGSALAKDIVRGGAVGGALGAAGNLASSAAPAAKAAFEKLRQGPPPGMQPALAGSSALRAVPRPVEPMGGPQINRMMPPKPTSADLAEFTPSSGSKAEQELFAGRESKLPPAPTKMPAQSKLPTFDEADVSATEQALRNKEASWQAEHNKNYVGKKIDPAEEYRGWEAMKAKQAAEREMRAKQSVRPGAKKGEEGMSAKERAAKRKAAQSPAPEQGAQIVPIRQEAPRSELTAANKPLIGPKQLPDDRILELARQGREAAGPQAPQGAQGLSPEQFEAGKQQLRDQFKKMSGGGNVVQHEGALQVADDPFIAGRVRELQQHVKSAEAAGDSDVAESLRNQIEELLAAPTEQLGKAQATDFLKKYGNQ